MCCSVSMGSIVKNACFNSVAIIYRLTGRKPRNRTLTPDNNTETQPNPPSGLTANCRPTRPFDTEQLHFVITLILKRTNIEKEPLSQNRHSNCRKANMIKSFSSPSKSKSLFNRCRSLPTPPHTHTYKKEKKTLAQAIRS